MNFVAIDFETANPKHNSACAIGITQVQDGIVQNTFYSLIRPPELEFSHWNTRVHGISESDVVDSPSLKDLWDFFLDICLMTPSSLHTMLRSTSVYFVTHFMPLA